MTAAVARGPKWRTSPRSLLVLVTLLFCATCSLPYAVAAARTPPESRFTGMLLNPYDQAYYLAAQRSASEDLSRSNRFSSEDRASAPIARLYPILGEVESRTGIGPVALYHGARMVGVLALPALIFHLMSFCFPSDPRRALRATLFALFSVGLATLGANLSSIAGDNVPEATLFYSAAVFPHFTLAYVGYTMALLAIVLAWRGGTRAQILGWGLGAGLLLGVTHTFLLMVLGVTLAILLGAATARQNLARPSRRVLDLVVAGAAILGPALPFLIALRDEMARFDELRGRPFHPTPSASWFTFIAAHAILAPLVVFGARTIITHATSAPRHADPERGDFGVVAILGVLFVVHCVLMFATFTPFQRRFSEGAVIPFAAVATVGLATFRRRQSFVVTLVVLAGFLAAGRAARQAEYIPTAYNGLFQMIGAGDVVLAGDELGWVIPAQSPGTVFLGRLVETIHFEDKRRLRDSLMRNTDITGSLQRFRAEGVTIVIFDDKDPSFTVPLDSLPPGCRSTLFRVGTVTGFRLGNACPPG